MSHDLDIRPRRVWLGLTVPGKTMMRVLESRDRRLSDQSLTELYRDEVHVALYSAALALHLLPRHGESRKMHYGAVLADIRDFLMFRFRTKAFMDSNAVWSRDDDIIASATDKELLHHVIERLDGLSRDISTNHASRMTEMLASIRQLRDLLKNAARRVYPGDPEDYAEYEVRFALPPQGQPP